MTYLFNNTVEINNDSGNSIPISANTTINSNTNPIYVTGNVTVSANSETGTEVSYIRSDNNTQLDTGGRLRVAQAGQQWWYVPSVDKDGDLRYAESFTGTGAASVWIHNLASIHLTSGTSSNGYTIRYSRRRHKIRPAVSHQWYTTANFDGIQTNVTKRLGMFTNYNGIFFEVSDDLYCVVRRRLTDGTLKELRVKRDAFSHDRLNGVSGQNPTGYNWDTITTAGLTGYTSKTNVTVGATTVYRVVFTHDGTANTNKFVVGDKVVVSGMNPTTYNNSPIITALDNSTVTVTYVVDPGSFTSMTSGQILKNGFVREHTFFFDFNGGRTSHIRFCIQGPLGPETIHVFDLANTTGTQYENAPALMERAEVQNTGVVDHLPSLTISGSAYNVEAELELNPGFGTAYNNTPVIFAKQNTPEYAIMGLGLRAGEPYQRADLQLRNVSITDLGNVNPQNSGIFFWRLLLNPTLGGDFSGNGSSTEQLVGKASRHWHFTANTTFSGGIELMTGYAHAVTTIPTETALNFLNIGSNLAYDDADKIVLIVKQLVGGTDNGAIVATMNFIESL